MVTSHLGSPSSLFSTFRLPPHCLVWLAFPSSSSLPSFHFSLQPLFLILDSPLLPFFFWPFSSLWTALFFLLVDSPLLTVRCPFFYCFTAPFSPFWTALACPSFPSFLPIFCPSFRPSSTLFVEFLSTFCSLSYFSFFMTAICFLFRCPVFLNFCLPLAS